MNSSLTEGQLEMAMRWVSIGYTLQYSYPNLILIFFIQTWMDMNQTRSDRVSGIHWICNHWVSFRYPSGIHQISIPNPIANHCDCKCCICKDLEDDQWTNLTSKLSDAYCNFISIQLRHLNIQNKYLERRCSLAKSTKAFKPRCNNSNISTWFLK
jgi:hypothetical protein